MSTKLSQDQVENLNSDLDSLDSKDVSLESKISVEDSINDGVDSDLQSQIDVLKGHVLSTLFGIKDGLKVSGGSLVALSPSEFQIPVTDSEYKWYLNNNLVATTGTNVYTTSTRGSYRVEITYTTNLGIYTFTSDPVIY
jgi:hypothetical protein